MNRPYEAELVYRRGPRRESDSLELATLGWVDRFNNGCLFRALRDVPFAESEASGSLYPSRQVPALNDSSVQQNPGAVQLGSCFAKQKH